ncbi:MAG TPA: IS5 family transposase [Nitrospira sp.]|jgi:transposase|nr:IS5 family transposase [Nitrospira sp.]HQV47326.1 IS5 family transposase [Nitrospira sp.]HQW91169.1 IS5 family transposase [Nitrospira sp.]
MMGTADPQPSMFYHINLEQFVTVDHPMRKIRPLIDAERIRQLCEPLYAETGRPSIPPEQLFLALLGGYLLGVTSERALVRELTGNLVLRWFVGLDLDTDPWDHSTFSQNRKRRFTESGLLEQLFDETVALAIKQKLVSQHTTLDGTLVQANASHKSFVPIEVFLQPEDYKKRIRSLDSPAEQDPGNPTITFRGERRSNQTHVSMTDPDAKLANKGNGTAAMVGYTVNGLMENRHRLLLGINVESFRGPASETDGGRTLIDRFHRTHRQRIQTVGADKGYFAQSFLTALFRRRITPHIATKATGQEAVHQRVRRLGRTVGYRLSQRARKKIEELWGEAKCWHGFRRFRRRGLLQVRDEAYLMGWLLNLKRLAKLLPAPA